MLATIKHQDKGDLVIVAKLLTGYLKVTKKVTDFAVYKSKYDTFDAGFVSHVVAWQTSHKVTPDGVIDPDTWTAIAESTPTCSTSKNRISGPTLALQVLLDGNIACDGIYGPRTKAAVAAFQDAMKLSVDGICGPKTWNALIVGKAAATTPTTTPIVTPTVGKFVQPVDYKQYDSKWANKMYSNHNDKSQTMKSSGCGPTATADVVATLKNKSEQPYVQLAQLAMQWGDRTYDNGTNWSFFPHVQKYFGFSKMVQSSTWSALTACLDAGGYVVCSMGPGYWTTGGHYICVWKYDSTYVYANDPASATRKKQKIADFKKQRKQYFCFYPTVNTTEDNAGGKEETASKPANLKRGSKICDISKYQPTVNYKAFAEDTSLIIMRAGYRGTGGTVKEDQKFDLHAKSLTDLGIRFGVYFFSIATTEERAREEARMFVKYAKPYNPLFWAMDAENDGITHKAIAAFADEMRKLGCEKVGCYVANHLYQKYDYATLQYKFDFTWIPRYGSTKPVYPCDLWQYTSTGSVKGISGNVDLNKITGEGKPLEWFIK